MADVSDPAAAPRIVEQCCEALLPPVVLVNAVGISPRVPIEELALDDWRQVHGVNVESFYLLSKQTIRHMRTPRGKEGSSP